MMFSLLVIFSLLLIITAITPHFPGKHWLIRLWEFPRVQQLVMIVVLLLCWPFASVSHPAWYTLPALLAAVMVYQLSWILPYTRLWPVQVKQHQGNGPRISVLTSNVFQPNDQYQALLDLVRQHNPDMLVTLESDPNWQRALSVLEQDYPHRLACPLDNLYGMHLYSKFPFRSQELRFVVETDVPSMHVSIEVGGQPVQLYFLHPKPPSPTENKTAKPRDIELALYAEEVAQQPLPFIVSGDLNDVAWSPTTRNFRHRTQALDPRIGRGFFNTFHANYRLVRWPLDHVFHSQHFELVELKRLPSIGSDHFPLYFQLALKSALNADV